MVGNDAFEGYAVDLISEIANVLKFNFTFKWVDDGNYGSKKEDTNEWNGMIGELRDGVRMKLTFLIIIFEFFFFLQAVGSNILSHAIQLQKADLAIADLTINTPRNDAIDFSMPFMKLGDPLFFMEKSNNQHETIVIIRNLDPLCGSKKSSANSDRLPQSVPSHDLDQYRDRICHGVRLFWPFFSLAIYIIYIFLVSVMLHTVARFTPVEWVLLDACDLAGNPTEVVRLMLMITMIMVIFVMMMIAILPRFF